MQPRRLVSQPKIIRLSGRIIYQEDVRAIGQVQESRTTNPDYYFSLAPVKAAIPDAHVIAAPATVAAIEANVAGKIEAWGPQLGDNGPQSVDDVVMPEPSEVTTLTVDGETVEIVTIEDMHDRRYHWVPSLEAVFGGVLVYGGLHPWIADVPNPADRAAWIRALDGIAARNPKIVVPGHMKPDWPTDLSGASFTRDYLVVYEEEFAKADGSAELIAGSCHFNHHRLPDQRFERNRH